MSIFTTLLYMAAILQLSYAKSPIIPLPATEYYSMKLVADRGCPKDEYLGYKKPICGETPLLVQKGQNSYFRNWTLDRIETAINPKEFTLATLRENIASNNSCFLSPKTSDCSGKALVEGTANGASWLFVPDGGYDFSSLTGNVVLQDRKSTCTKYLTAKKSCSDKQLMLTTKPLGKRSQWQFNMLDVFPKDRRPTVYFAQPSYSGGIVVISQPISGEAPYSYVATLTPDCLYKSTPCDIDPGETAQAIIIATATTMQHTWTGLNLKCKPSPYLYRIDVYAIKLTGIRSKSTIYKFALPYPCKVTG